jgi:Ser/Thr protein kinase RdoA (MazF antagonist)
LTDAALSGVAALLRRYHEAAAGFDPAPHRWPASPPDPFGGRLVLHNDPNLDNVVFRHGRAVALIDFDLASPGARVWDVAAAVRLWAPLRQDADVADARRGRVLRRFRLFADAYGLTDDERAVLVDAVIANHDWLYQVVRDGAENGHAGFADYWLSGARDRAARTRRWYVRSTALLRSVLN